jgi:nucleoid DNA-binding protein
MIATYIQELLATNNRVIVPNFGAFLVRATSKSKDANTLAEKLKDIYFSPFLKFNDELLEKYIIKKDSVSKEQAAQKIKEFIDEVKKELDQEKTYSIKDFGQFVADKQGKVQFITIGKEEMTEKPAAEKKAAKNTSAKKPTVKKAASAEESKKEETKIIKKEEPKKEEVKKPETKKAEPEKESKLQEFKPEEKKETPVIKEQEKKPIYNYKKEKKPVNKGLIWAIAIGLPIAAIFIWGILNINTVKKVFNKDKAKTEQIAKKKSATKKTTTTTTKTDQSKKEKTATTKSAAKKAVVKKAVVVQKKYYIIAGSFKNEKYAVSYLNKLKAEGYNAEKLAKRNGMYAVSFNSFTDKRKAIAEYKFIAQEKGLQAWILYY